MPYEAPQSLTPAQVREASRIAPNKDPYSTTVEDFFRWLIEEPQGYHVTVHMTYKGDWAADAAGAGLYEPDYEAVSPSATSLFDALGFLVLDCRKEQKHRSEP